VGYNNKYHEIQGIIRDYFETLYSNKLQNLKEMDKFLDSYDHTKLNHEDIERLNRCVICNEMEATIKSLPKKKSSRPKDSSLNFTRSLKKN
jgi:hypothetical protein